MLIIGAKGFAKEVLEIFYQLNQLDSIAFYDDINPGAGEFLYGTFPILKNEEEAKDYFSINGYEFTIGIGDPHLRYKLYQKFKKLGARYVSTISPLSVIGHYDVEIGEGSNVLSNAIFSNSVKMGKGCIAYYNVQITHDCKVGDFVELSPNAILLGNVEIGPFSNIGSNSTILPKVKIGKNVIIGAGSVVTKDIPDNCMAFGIPAKVVKGLEALKF